MAAVAAQAAQRCVAHTPSLTLSLSCLTGMGGVRWAEEETREGGKRGWGWGR